MKTLSIFTVLLLISLSLYSQKTSYSIETGANYSFFTNSYETGTQEVQMVPYGMISEKEISSKGKTGFFLNNNFSFPVNKFIAFKTGFGFSLNNVDLTTTINYSWEYSIDTPFVIFIDTSSTGPYYISEFKNKANYNIFQIRIPMQLQFSFFNEKLLIASGISISALIQAKNTPETNTINRYTYIANNDFENIFMNLNFGVEYNLFNNVYLGVQYEYSVTDLMKGDINPYNQTQSYYTTNYAKIYNKIHLNSISLNLSYKF